MIQIAQQAAVIRHQEGSGGIQKLFAFQVVIIPYPSGRQSTVVNMQKTDHTAVVTGKSMFFFILLQTGMQRLREKGCIDPAAPFGEQAGQTDGYNPVGMGNLNSLCVR